jgi:hypothetical protein
LTPELSTSPSSTPTYQFIYNGWILKLSGDQTNWRKRWAILDTNELRYYKDKKVLFYIVNII